MSRNDEWTTPIKLFNHFDRQYDFTLDAAATRENALCDLYFTKETNALNQILGRGERAWCNPPYSMAEDFATWAHYQATMRGACVVMLLPVRSDRIWFQTLLHHPATTQTWITGRLHFGNSKKGAFMYNVLFAWNLRLVEPYLDASMFNDNKKGGATT